MKYILVLTFFSLSACSSQAPIKSGPTYRSCLAEQDILREKRFKEMPEYLQTFAGRLSVVKYFEKRPKEFSTIISNLKNENAVFNARKSKDSSGESDLRLLDTSPGINRLLIGFEKRNDLVRGHSDSDKLVLKIDYSKPLTGYYFPLSAIQREGKGLGGKYISSVKINAPKSYSGDTTIGKISFSLYLEPLDKDYLYIEWINHSYDPTDSPNWKGIRAIVYLRDDDRFLEWEHPYFDPKGELNPEDCNSLEGG